MARKDNSPAISFFSFQDIITSVTGIMFLVMLLLTLLLLLRETASTSPEQAAAQALQEDVRVLRERISRMTEGSVELQARLEELGKLDAKALPQRKAELLRRLEELQTEMVYSTSTEEFTRKEIERLRAEVAKVQTQYEPVARELQELQEEVSALEAQKERLEDASEKSKKMMRFTWTGSDGRRPLLVECSENAILVGQQNSSTPVKAFRRAKGESDVTQMEAEFLAWAKKQSPSDVYFVLLAKPSSFAYVENLAEILGEDGYQRGREVLPSDNVRVFELPEEGQKK